MAFPEKEDLQDLLKMAVEAAPVVLIAWAAAAALKRLTWQSWRIEDLEQMLSDVQVRLKMKKLGPPAPPSPATAPPLKARAGA